MENTKTFLCLSCEIKGVDTLRALKEEGNKVLLVTSEKLRNAPWPHESIDEIFYVKEMKHCVWNLEELTAGLAHVMKSQPIDRVLAIDDFDVEKAAYLREEFRIPGMGQTTARYYRDKLAMRFRAADAGITVPAFSSLFNDQQITDYLNSTGAPWIIKPRGEAASAGLTKVNSFDEAWEVIHSLGEQRHNYLIEEFKPGDVFHVDTVSTKGEVAFSCVSKYMNPPFEVVQGGGIFRSHIVDYDSEDCLALEALNKQLLETYGMHCGTSHSEFIKSHSDGKFYLVETSFRVAGAHLADMIEKATGLNLWKEWARVESAAVNGIPYVLPELRKDYSGIVVSLSKYEFPDTSSFNDPEIVWKMEKPYHIGFILRSNNLGRIKELLNDYALRIGKDFHAVQPPKKSYRE